MQYKNKGKQNFLSGRGGGKESVSEKVMLVLGLEGMGSSLPARQVGGRTSGFGDYPAPRWRGAAQPNTFCNSGENEGLGTVSDKWQETKLERSAVLWSQRASTLDRRACACS